MKIAIIGKGNVGTALGGGLTRAGHEIRYGHRDPKETVASAASWGDAIILAVPFAGVPAAANEIGRASDGKTLIDVTNALDSSLDLAVGFTTSGAEELQKLLPGAYVVKAFNTVFAQNQGSGSIGREQLTAFIAGDDPEALGTVTTLARDLGFDPVVVGGLHCARYLEPMAIMIIGMAFKENMGTKMGYKLIRG
ncbi:MAG TPA: NAD(P)-binding domain-containing protein [Methanoregulaceae archaeon]|nr:NAD(P)-binding domain-containing protein [Methanoregulaceae archaeon]